MDFHITFPDKPVYLERSENNDKIDDGLKGETDLLSLSNLFTNQHTIIFFCNIFKGDNDEISNYLKSAIESQELRQKIVATISSNVALMYGIHSTSRMNEWPFDIYRGVCVYSLKSDETFNNESLIQLAHKHNFKSYFTVTKIKGCKCSVVERDSLSMDMLSEHTYKINDTWKKLCNGDLIRQDQSRLFTYPVLCPVFDGFKRAKDILHKCRHIPEVVTLLDIADKNIPENFDVQEIQKQLKYPFVIVEGLDATGKTTLTETLEKKLEATRFYSPPPKVNHLRKIFVALPEIIQRAYYCVGNFIAAIQIAKECQHKAVIMDRFWHSTAAYGIANETSTSDIPPRQHWVYQWPSDLLKPNLVLFLTVTEQVRKQRLSAREGEKTFEEQHLDKDRMFRQRLCEAYRRMENPACVEIDATGSKESVVELAVVELEKHGITLGIDL